MSTLPPNSNKLSKAERAIRAEKKRAHIRHLVWNELCHAERDKLTEPNRSRWIDAFIEGLKRRNPQESHLVQSVCAGICSNVDAFCKEMIPLYGALYDENLKETQCTST